MCRRLWRRQYLCLCRCRVDSYCRRADWCHQCHNSNIRCQSRHNSLGRRPYRRRPCRRQCRNSNIRCQSCRSSSDQRPYRRRPYRRHRYRNNNSSCHLYRSSLDQRPYRLLQDYRRNSWDQHPYRRRRADCMRNSSDRHRRRPADCTARCLSRRSSSDRGRSRPWAAVTQLHSARASRATWYNTGQLGSETDNTRREPYSDRRRRASSPSRCGRRPSRMWRHCRSLACRARHCERCSRQASPVVAGSRAVVEEA